MSGTARRLQSASAQHPARTLLSTISTGTASNGDQINIHYYGSTGALFPDQNGEAQLHDDLAFDITGGTGHFAAASGHGRLTAGGTVYFYPRPTIVTSELKGTIYMHSN
jgi:hypothetical protein